MRLSKQALSNIQNSSLSVDESVFQLPEKVLQFGTGVLLRGLCDYFIDKANKQHVFNGRVVVVKSTAQGGTDAFTEQDCLYTHFIKGIEDGNAIEETIINASISRVLAANEQWNEILSCAANPAMQIIISNTTEVGIAYTEEIITTKSPASFPGKLLAFLHERYKIFKGSSDAGMVIIPTELIVDNANKLKEIVIKLAAFNSMDAAFIMWLQMDNHFCNSLVDRIVPGKLSALEKSEAESSLGYEDDLMIMSEVYRLWAIETDNEKVKQILSFAQADKGIILAPDIYKFRELKLRLLNGTHTFSCALAVLAGFETVKQAMADALFKNYVTALMLNEIAVAISDENISYPEAKAFAFTVIDRFANPYIDHKWLSISLQYSSKMNMRNLVTFQKYYLKQDAVPQLMALGFAAYLLFMKTTQNDNGSFIGDASGNAYTVHDDKAGLLYKHWQQKDEDVAISQILSDEKLWSANLNNFNGFFQAVIIYIESLRTSGVIKTIESLS